MPQQILYTDYEEDQKVKYCAGVWKLSKANTIKKMIKLFKIKETEPTTEEDDKIDLFSDQLPHEQGGHYR